MENRNGLIVDAVTGHAERWAALALIEPHADRPQPITLGGKEALLCFMGHALMENRNGLIVDVVTTRASGHQQSPRRRAARSVRSITFVLTPAFSGLVEQLSSLTVLEQC